MNMIDGDAGFERLIEDVKSKLRVMTVQSIGASHIQRNHRLMYHHAMRVIDRLIKDEYLEFYTPYEWKITEIARAHETKGTE